MTKKRGRQKKMIEQVVSEGNEIKKGTPPAWQPASKQAELKAPKGFFPRWVRADAGEIAKKKAEGWLIMKPEDNKGHFRADDVNDGTPLHNGIRFRDMIAMMLPEERKEGRDAYFKAENKRAVSGIFDKTDEESKKMGLRLYTPKGQAGRIVIG